MDRLVIIVDPPRYDSVNETSNKIDEYINENITHVIASCYHN